MKVLVTGCAGFIGFHIVKNLLKSQHEITGIDNLDKYYDQELKTKRLAELKNTNFTFINLDINHLSKIKNDFDLVINFAAQPGVRLPKSDWHKYFHSNIYGFISVCNFCLENKNSRLIYASSSSVYDGKQNKASCETDRTAPSSIYGTTKAFNEIYAETLASSHNLKAIGFRFFTVYGPWGRPDMAYFLFSKQIRESGKIILHNKGRMFRDMTYIEDIISGVKSGIDLIIKKDFSGHDLFNLGCNNPIKTNDLLTFIGKYLNKDYLIENIDKNFESQYTHADLTKSKNILDYDPKTNVETGMLKFLEWFDEYEKY